MSSKFINLSLYIYIHICMNIDQVYITVNQCCYFVIKCSWSHSINLSCELANQLFCKLEHQLFCKPLRNLVSNWIKILHINFYYNILFFSFSLSQKHLKWYQLNVTKCCSLVSKKWQIYMYLQHQNWYENNLTNVLLNKILKTHVFLKTVRTIWHETTLGHLFLCNSWSHHTMYI